MKKILAIALLALLGCVSNKPAIEQKILPNCEEFYEFYRGFSEISSENRGIEADSLFNLSLEILEMAVEQYNCNVIITCDEKTYCVGPML
jgi:hypothetical protein